MELAPLSQQRPSVGLVLAGGAARGAYEVGVLEYIVETVAQDLGYDVPLDILCGTSVGAINVCAMAAFAEEPRGRVARLAEVWSGLRVEEVLHARSGGVMSVMRSLLGRNLPMLETGALFDAKPLEQILTRSIPFERIDTHLRAGRIRAVTVSTTQLATGRTVVFVQRRRAQPSPWGRSHSVKARSVRMRAIHPLASAAVPIMFPAVRIDGLYYCDGGIRQNVPLSPARRLGAHALIVVNPRYRKKEDGTQPPPRRDPEDSPSPLFIIGKTLNALMLDRVENDLDRLDKINTLLEAGVRRYGPSFIAEMNEELGLAPPKALRTVRNVHIRPSINIGERCVEYVASRGFHVPGTLGRVMKQLAEDERAREQDLLSYLLFDGAFASELMELGRQDAAAHHEELCALFEEIRGLAH